jgi:hypothetical protein
VEIDWDTIDWGPSLPGRADIVRAHRHLRYERIEPATLATPALTRLLEEFGRIYSDPPVFAGFRVVHDDATARWFATRDRLNELGFFGQFLGSSEVRTALPELSIPERLQPVKSWARDDGDAPEQPGFWRTLPAALGFSGPGDVPLDLGFRRIRAGALGLDGELATMLVGGGVYTKYSGTYRDAKQLGMEVVAELVGDRYTDFRVYLSTAPWAGYFYGFTDYSWMLIDRPTARILLLCKTDTD